MKHLDRCGWQKIQSQQYETFNVNVQTYDDGL